MIGEPMRRAIAVVVFPGSNDDRDAAWALAALGAEPVLVWHAEAELPGRRRGRPARRLLVRRLPPLRRDRPLRARDAGGDALRRRRRLVLGICNGFQILCEAGLLPGVLRPNASLSFVCRDVRVRVERADTPFTTRCEPGQTLVIPVKHGEGCFHVSEELLAAIGGARSCSATAGENPNGAVDDVAGVVNVEGNVMGLMPHPEHLLAGPSASAASRSETRPPEVLAVSESASPRRSRLRSRVPSG